MAFIREKRGTVGGILVSGLAVLILLPQAAQARIRRPGAKVLVMAVEPHEEIKGELVGVREDAVVVEDEREGAKEVAVERIRSVRILRRSGVLPGILGGGLAGAIAGAAILGSNLDPEPWDFASGAYGALLGLGGGFVAGGLLGGIAGGVAGVDKTYSFENMTPEEKTGCLAKLRKHARVRDYR
jgi:hypothetical protein